MHDWAVKPRAMSRQEGLGDKISAHEVDLHTMDEFLKEKRNTEVEEWRKAFVLGATGASHNSQRNPNVFI